MGTGCAAAGSCAVAIFIRPVVTQRRESKAANGAVRSIFATAHVNVLTVVTGEFTNLALAIFPMTEMIVHQAAGSATARGGIIGCVKALEATNAADHA